MTASMMQFAKYYREKYSEEQERKHVNQSNGAKLRLVDGLQEADMGDAKELQKCWKGFHKELRIVLDSVNAIYELLQDALVFAEGSRIEEFTQVVATGILSPVGSYTIFGAGRMLG